MCSREERRFGGKEGVAANLLGRNFFLLERSTDFSDVLHPVVGPRISLFTIFFKGSLTHTKRFFTKFNENTAEK